MSRIVCAFVAALLAVGCASGTRQATRADPVTVETMITAAPTTTMSAAERAEREAASEATKQLLKDMNKMNKTTTTRRATSEAECRRMAGGIVDDNQAFADSLAGMQANLLVGDLAAAGILYGWADSELFIVEASFDEFKAECRSHFPEETRRAEALLRDMRQNWAEATRICRETLEPLGLAIC